VTRSGGSSAGLSVLSAIHTSVAVIAVTERDAYVILRTCPLPILTPVLPALPHTVHMAVARRRASTTGTCITCRRHQFLQAIGNLLFPELPALGASLPMGNLPVNLRSVWVADSSKASPGADRSISTDRRCGLDRDAGTKISFMHPLSWPQAA
jgi:hypothetical protein